MIWVVCYLDQLNERIFRKGYINELFIRFCGFLHSHPNDNLFNYYFMIYVKFDLVGFHQISTF